MKFTDTYYWGDSHSFLHELLTLSMVSQYRGHCVCERSHHSSQHGRWQLEGGCGSGALLRGTGVARVAALGQVLSSFLLSWD